MYDVAIIGGGVSGCACAWNCGRLGLKTILIEKKSYLGGAISSQLVTPIMKTDDKGINIEFYNELLKKMKEYDAQITYSDGNEGWFNPELIKIVLDDMLISNGVEILFNSEVNKVTQNVDSIDNDKNITNIEIKRNILSQYDYKIHNDKILNNSDKKNDKIFENNFYFKNIYSKFFVDASGDAIISNILNLKMQNDNDLKQAESLRFIMANIDMETFSEWLKNKDSDRNVTSVANIDNEIHLTTAYTWDTDKHWALEDIFKNAIKNGDLLEEDTAYFQIFSIAKMPNAIGFNCPRVNQNQDYDKKLINARKTIYRLSKFVKKYFPGFENAYISKISEELGVRVSNRPLAKYNYSVNDIINNNSFENIALHSNYPIDVHSNEKDGYVLDKNKGYDFPIESLMSSEIDNLFNIGKAIGADFKSQAALRVQKSCFSMGEAIALYISDLLK